MRLPYLKALEDVDFIVIGVPFDSASAARVGQRFAPQAIREASVYCKTYHPELDINIFEHCSGVDYGDIDVVPGNTERSLEKIRHTLFEIFKKAVVPVCLGGEHTIVIPELRALRDACGPVAVVQFDAHHDCWERYLDEKENQATPIRRGIEEGCILTEHSIQLGLRGPEYSASERQEVRDLGLELITAVELHKMGMPEAARRIQQRVQDAPVFVTFDADFLDAASAPGATIPMIGGFTTWHALQLIRSLKGLNFKGFDIVEIVPAYDPSQITAIAAANIAWEFIALTACNRI
jgi:agmatinase